MDRMRLIDTERNPFYQHAKLQLFIAEDNGKPVGRIAAVVNERHNKKYNDKLGFIGFFESIDDQAVAGALFTHAESWLREHDMKNFEKDVAIIKDLYNRGWEENWGAVEMTDEEITMLASELKQIVEPNYILFVEKPSTNGKPETIGFSLVVPDINQAFKAGSK